MEQDDKYKNTTQTWDQLAARYREGFNGLNLYEETYEVFCELVKGTEVLEIGCGPATITHRLALLRPDFKILATDVSFAMLEETKKLLPQIQTMQLDARRIGTLPEKFDGIVCGFCLPYIDKKDAEKLLVDVSALLNPEGIFYLSFVPANNYEEKMQISSDGKFSMLFHYYTDEQMVNWAGAQSLRLLKSFSVFYSKPDGLNEVHRVMIFKKRKNNWKTVLKHSKFFFGIAKP